MDQQQNDEPENNTSEATSDEIEKQEYAEQEKIASQTAVITETEVSKPDIPEASNETETTSEVVEEEITTKGDIEEKEIAARSAEEQETGQTRLGDIEEKEIAARSAEEQEPGQTRLKEVAVSDVAVDVPTTDIHNVKKAQDAMEIKASKQNKLNPAEASIQVEGKEEGSFSRYWKLYWPWFSGSILGFILVLVAIILLTTGVRRQQQTFSLENINLPSLQGSMKIHTVDGEELIYNKQLKFIGNLEARDLRNKIEPKLKRIYEGAGLKVDSALIIAFKYGGGEEDVINTSESGGNESISANAARKKRIIRGRLASSSGRSLLTRHWVYLTENITDADFVGLVDRVKQAATNEPNIGIDIDSITIYRLANISQVDALTILSQHGFFKNGLSSLDFNLLATIGLVRGPSSIGLQSGDDGLCPGFKETTNIILDPPACNESSSTYLGMVCKFKCRRSLTLVGPASRICLSSGHWSGSPVSCTSMCPAIILNTPGTLFPRSCSSSNASVGQMCFIHCPPLYQLFSAQDDSLVDSSSYIRQCRDDGTWSGDLVYCKAKCRSLNFNAYFAFYLVRNFNIVNVSCGELEGDVCLLTCANGYVVNGGGSTQQITCDTNGKWNKEVLHCKKECSKIIPNSNQTVQPKECETKPYEGLKCTFSCDDGYKLDNSSVRHCSAADWQEAQPNCVAVCPTLMSVSHGSFASISGDCFEETPQNGTACRLTCDAGYLPSVESVTCDMALGNWTASNITCKRSCGQLPIPSNSLWEPNSCLASSMFGQCKLKCNTGYILIGKATLTCVESTGKWSDRPGKCERNCANLSSPANGDLQPLADCGSNPLSGTMCHFSCNLGFSLSSKQVIRCQADGQWDRDAPTCVSVTTYYLIRTVYHDPPVCLSADTEGGNNIVIKSVSCGAADRRNRWSVESSSELKNAYTGQCLTAVSSPSLVQFGDCSNGTNTIRNNEFIGGQHYQIVHNGTSGFLSAGSTLNAVTITKAASLFSPAASWKLTNLNTLSDRSLHGHSDGACAPLLAPTDSNITTSCGSGRQAAGTTCDITCNSGYTLLSGGSTVNVECTDGVWALTEDMKCVANDGCTRYPVELISGGAKISCPEAKVPRGTTCVFTCNDAGHLIVGQSSVYCNQGSRWSSYDEVSCMSSCISRALSSSMILSSIKSTSCVRNSSTAYGGVCQYSCSNQIEPGDLQVASCLSTGEFDHELPSCNLPCKALDPSTTFSIQQCDAQLGKPYGGTPPCSLTCLPGYVTRSSTIQCVNGEWNDPNGCMVSCRRLPSLANTTVEPALCRNDEVPTDTTCTLACDQGLYFMIGGLLVDTMQRTCLADGLWDGELSFCDSFCAPLSPPQSGGYYWPSSCTAGPQRENTDCFLKCQGSTQVHGGKDKLTCSSDGTWVTENDRPLGNCARLCPALVQPRLSTVFPEHCSGGAVQPGTECVIECPLSTERRGPGIWRCLGTAPSASHLGTWSSPEQTFCMGRCPPLAIPRNTIVYPASCALNHKLEGDVCTFECERGLLLSGVVTLRCTEGGVWSDELPLCQRSCLGIRIFNGKMSCAGLPLDATVGFDHYPGTRCRFFCDDGYAPSSYNEVTCTQQGLWKPEPFCKRETETFSIFQKIEDESKCLIVSLNSANVGSNWILTFTNSADGCVAEGNNALWFWHGNKNLKHAQTGLCITAERARRESLIILEICDTDNPLQHWDCDSWRLHRVLLKGTDLSIDTTYTALGPILETWTHTKAYWLTFNEELETTASVCSYRPVGTCPGISISNVVATPNVCTSDGVLVWQKCDIACTSNSYAVGSLSSTECLPTGKWKDIEEVQCVKRCPALVDDGGKKFSPSSCGLGTVDHLSQCNVQCTDGLRLSNDEVSVTMLCEDGEWAGPKVHCLCELPAPAHGSVNCLNETCQFACDPGYELNDESKSTIDCRSLAGTPNSITCKEDAQFVICSEQVVGSTSDALCLTVDNSISSLPSQTRKMVLDKNNKSFYWKWNGDMLQNAATGSCLFSSTTSHWSALTVKACDKAASLTFACHNHRHSTVIRSIGSSSYIGFGELTSHTPAVLVKDTTSIMVEWAAVRNGAIRSPICFFKPKGQCPPLFVNDHTSLTPTKCDEDSTVGSTCTLGCVSGGRFLDQTTNQFSSDTSIALTCTGSGKWSSMPVMPCVSATGNCPVISITTGLVVEPAKCMSGDTLTSGFQCHFTCKPGYILQGKSITYCKSDSTWSSPEPSCKRYCPALLKYKHVIFSPPECAGAAIPSGTSCALTCMTGYFSASSSVTVQCGNDGAWADQAFKCAKACPLLSSTTYNVTNDPTLVTSGNKLAVTSSTCASSTQIEGATCTFSCPNNFILVDGEARSTCTKGAWSPAVPRCMIMHGCPEMSSMTGVASVDYLRRYSDVAVVVGTVISVTCNEGYIVDGDAERLCSAGGVWGGDGPTAPACAQSCPRLRTDHLSPVTPPDCSTGDSKVGKTCQLNCAGGTKTRSGTASVTMRCISGSWSPPLPVCVYRLNILDNGWNYKYEFMMITRAPERGCFYPDSNNVIRWKFISQCHVTNKTDRWIWTKDRAVKNVGTSLCLEPIAALNGAGSLSAAPCTTLAAQYFTCGNSKSSFDWASLYSMAHDVWEMAFATDKNTGRISSVDVNKVSDTLQQFSKQNFATIQVFGTTDIQRESIRDVSVCSFLCGGRIPAEPSTGLIASPGFIQANNYIALTSCEWVIVAYGKTITLVLLDLALEGDPHASDPCQTDCVQVFDGLDSNPSLSNHLVTYTGFDMTMYNSRTVSTIGGSMLVKFTSDERVSAQGFIMKYTIEGIAVSSGCGVPGRSWIVPPVDAEPPIGRQPAISKWPWIVSIRKRAERMGKAYHQCAGVLVDDATVISAAHCANFAIEGFKTEQGVTIGIGQVSQFAMDDDLEKGPVTELVSVHIHPNYNAESRRNDIAVWKLKHRIRYSAAIQPICLPPGGYAMYHTFSPCYAVGWTQLDNGVVIQKAVEYRMKLELTSYCQLVFGLGVNSGYVCAALDRLDNSVARGNDDSEPLVCLSDNGKWYLAGVASHTRVGRLHTRRLYTSVHDNSRWLRETIDKTSTLTFRSRGLDLLADYPSIDEYDLSGSGEGSGK